MNRTSIITFTSDFGNREYYTGSVKGAILSVAPEACVVDLSHEIPPHDLIEGAFTLFAGYSVFPAGTVHLAVVDPEVGSQRGAIAAAGGGYFFVGPDNGLFSLVFEAEPPQEIVSLEAEEFFRKPVSPTFHGRDIFGPVAAHISLGRPLRDFGPRLQKAATLDAITLNWLKEDSVEGSVLHIDRFGNVITSLSESWCRTREGGRIAPVRIRVKGAVVDRFRHFYAEGQGDPLFFLVGSSGFYEIASFQKSAVEALGVRKGDRLIIELVRKEA